MSQPPQFESGAYRSPARRLSWPARRFPSLCAYLHIIREVVAGAHAARWGRLDDADWRRRSWRVVKDFESVGVTFELGGFEHLRDTTGPWVIVGNHMSTMETFALPSLVLPFSRLTFVVKRSLVEYPVFRHVMMSRRPILVDRRNPREDFQAVMEQGAERLSEGLSVAVFPQTTRTTRFDPAHFNTIGIKLAKRARVPVIPLAVKTDAWGNGRLLKDFGPIDPSRRVHLEFGPPLEVRGNGQSEHQAVIAFIEGKLAQWCTEERLG